MLRTDNLELLVESRRSFLKAVGIASAALAGAALSRTADAMITTPPANTDVNNPPRVKQVLVDPPFLPAHEQIASGGPKVVEVTLPIIEKRIVIDQDGTE